MNAENEDRSRHRLPWLISFSLDRKPTNQKQMKQRIMRSASVIQKPKLYSFDF